ncbi:MAG TPA: hypothetical protein DD789_12990, partial [Firmicutes bacterium]|nr:hypothetical protein [Bacillota bacterium]
MTRLVMIIETPRILAVYFCRVGTKQSKNHDRYQLGVDEMVPFVLDLDYQCWLQYTPIQNSSRRQDYQNWCNNLVIPVTTPVVNSAREEVVYALKKMVSIEPIVSEAPLQKKFVLFGIYGDSPLVDAAYGPEEATLDQEGYLIKTLRREGMEYLVITALTDRGLLYGSYHFLRLLQTEQDLCALQIREAPTNPLRLINHWDNMDG